jgi:hypothetical protein
MARSIAYWYDIIDAEKRTMSNLTGLQPNVDTSQALLVDVTTKSRVARWRLWMWCVAVCAYSVDVLFDLFKLDLEAIAQRSRYGSLPWYVAIAKEFQYGYNLIWNNNQFEYALVDEASKVVKLAAATEVVVGTSVIINLKVSELISGTPAPLNSAKLLAFQQYVAQRKPAGIVVHIISDNADDLRLYVKVGYDPLVLSATGESLLTPGVYPVEDSVQFYIQNLKYDGVLELCELVDMIQKVYGVNSAYVLDAQARYGANAFVPFAERYESNAGYLTIDPSNLLSATLTYAADV